MEAHLPQRVFRTRRLRNMDGVVAVVGNGEAYWFQYRGGLPHQRDVLFGSDSLRDVPGRTDGDRLHSGGLDRGWSSRLAIDDFRRPNLPTVLNDVEHEVGKIDHDVSIAEIVWHPGPPLHVGNDDVDGPT